MNVGRGVNWGIVGATTTIEVALVSVAAAAGWLHGDGPSTPLVVVGLVGLIAGGLIAGRLAGRRTMIAVRQGILTGAGAGTVLYALFVISLSATTGGPLAPVEIFGAGLVVVNIFVIVNVTLAVVGSWSRIRFGGVESSRTLQ